MIRTSLVFRRAASIGIASLAVLTCGAARLEAQNQLDQRRAVAADAAIRIFNPSGSVRITGRGRDSLIVRGRLADGAHIAQGGSDHAYKFAVEPSDPRLDAPASDLEIFVPVGSRVWVKTATGEIEVTGVTGDLDLFTVSGHVRVDGPAGNVVVESMDGNVEVAANASMARVRTGGGTVVLRGVIRESEVSTVSGAVLIGMEGPVRRARYESVSGEVSFKGDFEADGSLEAESHSGDIELRLPRTMAADYDVSAYGGVIRNELAPQAPAPRAGELHFSVGGGGVRVVVRTFKGTVAIKGK
ncbi:MAG: hypothetical protein ABJD11_09935 [Gemmatimonadota bacterium]